MVFTAFSVQTAVRGRAKLSAIKDLYFPVLERVDADIVRIDKMEELYIQVVVLGDRDALDTANEQATKADDAFKEIAGLYPDVPGNELHPEYSAHLRKIFSVDDVAGQNLVDCLFDRSTLGVDTKDQIAVALGSIIGEAAMMFDLNGHLLPRETLLQDGGSPKTV
jgi:hypothetical protein